MFGSSKFKKIKSKTFKSDNDRKRYFEIKKYYENKKNNNVFVFDKPTKKKK